MCSPFHLILALFPLETAFDVFTILTMIRAGLAGLCMMLYLTHKPAGHRFSPFDPAALFLSVSYALSSCFITQQALYMFTDVIVFFPLLFLFYEKLIISGKKNAFYLMCTILLLDNFYLTALLLPVLFLDLTFTRSVPRKKESIYLFLKTCLAALLSASITVIPGFHTIFNGLFAHDQWPEPSISHEWIALLSRLLPFSDISQTIVGSQGINLSLPGFVVFCFFLSFSAKDQSVSHRIKDAAFMFALLLLVNVSALQYITHSGYDLSSSVNMFCFVIVFYVISRASDHLYKIRNTHLAAWFPALILPLCILLISIQYYAYFSPKFILAVITLMVIYAILFVLYRIGSIKRRSFLLLSLFIASADLIFSAQISTGQIADTAGSVADQLSGIQDLNAQKDTPFSEFELDPPAGTPFHPDILPESALIPGVYEKPSIRNFEYETVNQIAASLGAEKDILHPANAEVNVNIPGTFPVTYIKSNNNIFSFYATGEDSIYHPVAFEFTPEAKGEYVASVGRMFYMGEASPDHPSSCGFAMTSETESTTTFPAICLSFDSAEYKRLEDALADSGIKPVSTGLLSCEYTVSAKKESTFLSPFYFDPLIRLSGHSGPAALINGPASRAAAIVPAGESRLTFSVNMIPFLFLLLLSALTVFVFFYLQSGADHLLFKKATALYKSCGMCIDHVFIGIYSFLRRHRIALLSFFIPLTVLLIICMVRGVYPFGSVLFFQDDGIAFTLPSFYLMREQILSKWPDYSWITGGSNMYDWFPNLFIYLYLLLIPEKVLIQALTILQLIKTALCGYGFYYYLTRRLSGHRFHKNDYRMLPITTAYALSSYMLNLREFSTWPDILLALPLLLVAMDHLMCQKRKAGYVLILVLSILISAMHAMYLCYFLIFWFFTYHFDGIKDFLLKGVRFALSSVLAAGMAFCVAYSLVFSRMGGGYGITDSALPNPFLFYQNYARTIRQLFLLPDPVSITENNGAINLYFGVFALILAVTAILFQLKKKPYPIRLGTILFILLSSNNDLLSYVWNGFHYQMMVPNRYSFLVIFLLLVFASECILCLRRIPNRVIISSFILINITSVIIFATGSDFYSAEAFILTTVISFVFGFLILAWKANLFKAKKTWSYSFCLLALLEISIQAGLFMNLENPVAIDLIKTEQSASHFLSDHIDNNGKMERTNFFSNDAVNINWYNQMPSLNQFNGYITKEQVTYARSLGLSASTNYFRAITNATPFSNSLSNTRYLSIDGHTSSPLTDLDHYDLIGQNKYSSILENPYPLSMGFYIPENVMDDTKDEKNMRSFANTLSCAFPGGKPVYKDPVDLVCVTKETEEKDIPKTNYIKLIENDPASNEINKKRTEIHFTPEEDGSYYYQYISIGYLGNLKAGKEYTIKGFSGDDVKYAAFRFDDDAYEQFCQSASRHQLDITEYTDSSLDGTIEFPDDGYLMLAIPYDEGWEATLDGKPIEIETMMTDAMALKGEKGTHTLHMEFHAPGKVMSLSITAFFWIIYALMVFWEHRRFSEPR